MTRMRIALTFLIISAGAAVAQEQPGDAEFCRSYATTTAVVAQDAISIEQSCQDFSKGVHGLTKMHQDWCMRMPQSEVEGAATHIRRLASRCAKGALAAPTDYGGYDIVGNERFERSYGAARGWQVVSAFSGRTFMYCAGVKDVGNGDVRLGRDLSEPGASGQWQLAVPLKAEKDWEGTFEVDGKGLGNGGGAQASGTAAGGWTIAWLTMGDVDGMRQGKTAVLGVGKLDFDFPLDGAAAAILKIEECVARKGGGGATAAAPQPAAVMTVAGEAPAASGPTPYDVQVTVSPKAQAKLEKIGEKIKILAVYAGEPVPSKKKLADEVGQIGLGDEEALLPLMGGNALMKGKLPREKLGWVTKPRLLINVVSARTRFPDNLLDCELFDDDLAIALKRPIEIHCKLIGE